VNDEQRTEQGMRVRRAVLGDAHVDRAVANTSEFTAPFQDWITRYAWGEIWTRPGLDLRPQDVAGCDRRNPVFLRQQGGLGPFARSGGSEQDEIQSHGYLQGKPIGSA